MLGHPSLLISLLSKDINKVPGLEQSCAQREQGGDVCGFIRYLRFTLQIRQGEKMDIKVLKGCQKIQPLQLGNSWKREMPSGDCQICAW